jgi:hypothetical protein
MSLDTALEHLRRFRATFNDGESVDEGSGLSADHLTTIICAVEAFGEDAVAGDPPDATKLAKHKPAENAE